MFTSKNQLSTGRDTASPRPMSLSSLPAHSETSPCGGPDALHRTLAISRLAPGALTGFIPADSISRVFGVTYSICNGKLGLWDGSCLLH